MKTGKTSAAYTLNYLYFSISLLKPCVLRPMFYFLVYSPGVEIFIFGHMTCSFYLHSAAGVIMNKQSKLNNQ